MGGSRTQPESGGFGYGRGRQKRGLQASFQAEIAQEIQQLISRSATEQIDLEALEIAARRCALRLAARAVESYLNQDHSDHGGPHLACNCGAQARYVGRRPKTWDSVLGALQLERAYYHCANCGQGFCPRDRALGLEQGSLSPAVQRMVALVGAMVSFSEGSLLLKELAAVELNAKRVERGAEALGAEVAADEKQNVEPIDQTPLPPTLYLSMDGTGIPMRSTELAGRTGKQADGSAKTREVKLCAIWSAESKDSQGRPVRDEGSVTYSAAIESAATRDTDPERSEFSERVLRELTRRRFTQAERTAAVADLASWIWKTTQELLPTTIQIGDRYHVKEHLSGVANSIYGAGFKPANTWTHKRYEKLDQGRFSDLLRAVRRHADCCEEARKCHHFLQHNRERLQYPKFEAEGLCTSSAVIEAGCKNVFGARLKRGGMFWTERGANAIIALRCSILSGRFQDFCERRSERAKVA